MSLLLGFVTGCLAACSMFAIARCEPATASLVTGILVIVSGFLNFAGGLLSKE